VLHEPIHRWHCRAALIERTVRPARKDAIVNVVVCNWAGNLAVPLHVERTKRPGGAARQLVCTGGRTSFLEDVSTELVWRLRMSCQMRAESDPRLSRERK